MQNSKYNFPNSFDVLDSDILISLTMNVIVSLIGTRNIAERNLPASLQNWHNQVVRPSNRWRICMGRSFDYRSAVELSAESIKLRLSERAKLSESLLKKKKFLII